MLREYYRFIKEYYKLAHLKKRYVFGMIITSIIYNVLSVVLPMCASLIIKYLTEKNMQMSYISLGIFVGLYLISQIANFINYKIFGYNNKSVYDYLTKKCFDKVVGADSNFGRTINKGRLMNSINGDIISVGSINDKIIELVLNLVCVLIVIGIVFYYDVVIGIFMLLYSFIYITTRNYCDRKINYYHNKNIVQEDKYSGLLTQIVSGLQEIKTFNMLPKLKEKLGFIQHKYSKNHHAKEHYVTIRDNDVRYITYVFRYLLYLYLIYLMSMGKIDVSVMVLMISYHENIVAYVNKMIESSAKIREGNTSVERIKAILEYDSTNIAFGDIDVDSSDIYGCVEYKNVSFKFKDTNINKDTYVLKDLSFKVNHNEIVAIVGEAGAGKTMLINLLLRLYKPTKGKITIDNTNIFDFTKKGYSNVVGVVNQKPFIFNLSIRKNLDFVDTNINHQIEACKKVGIHDFIESLPNGYNTILRENGSNVSGGQKQMISIARTLLTNSEIIVLDDITTSLDPDSAKVVPKIINKLKKDHTIIMITKKPDLMKEADRILVLDHGKIVDSGTHKQLLKRNEIYQMLQARKSPSLLGVFDNSELEKREDLEETEE